jgi:hypothetical protein
LFRRRRSNFENREHAVALTARVLKRLAVTLQTPIVSAAQISHEAARLLDRVPEGPLRARECARPSPRAARSSITCAKAAASRKRTWSWAF